MNYGKINHIDVANGPGVRLTLFVSGCNHHCKGCFNPETWDFQYGKPFTKETEEEILTFLAPDYISGLTLLGGEPLEHIETLLPLVKKVKEKFPQKTIWCYTGYVFEDIKDKAKDFLPFLDVLVDGPFVLEKKNISLAFRGSENQRLIDIPKTLKEKKVVLLSL